MHFRSLHLYAQMLRSFEAGVKVNYIITQNTVGVIPYSGKVWRGECLANLRLVEKGLVNG